MAKEHFTLSGHQTNDGGVLGPGTKLGHYVLLMPLGAGAMGQVWKARDEAGDRDVAIKMLPPTLRGNDDAINQVRKSFQQVHALTHQHIGKMLGMYDDATYGPYIVMDLVPGVPLSSIAEQRREQGNPLRVDEVLKFLKPVAEALDYAHGRGVLHRDVKPQNVLVQYEPMLEITLIDFGLAAAIRSTVSRFTQGGGIDSRGTRPYMSPEQIQGKRQLWDGRTDLYSLAVMGYELLSGHLPFDSDDDFALMYAITNTPADPIQGVPDAVNRVLLKGLSKQREERFGTCCDFIAALQTAFVPTPEPLAAARPNFKSLNQPKLDPKPAVPVEVLEVVSDAEAEEARAWQAARRAGTREGYETYIRQWPRGGHLAAAQQAIRQLSSSSRPPQRPPVPEKEPQPNRAPQRATPPLKETASPRNQRRTPVPNDKPEPGPKSKPKGLSRGTLFVVVGGILGCGVLFMLVVGMIIYFAADNQPENLNTLGTETWNNNYAPEVKPVDDWSNTWDNHATPKDEVPPVAPYTPPTEPYVPPVETYTPPVTPYTPPTTNRLTPGGY